MAITRQFLVCDGAGVTGVDPRPGMPDDLRACQDKFGSKLVMVHGDVGQESTAQQFTMTAMENSTALTFLSTMRESVVSGHS